MQVSVVSSHCVVQHMTQMDDLVQAQLNCTDSELRYAFYHSILLNFLNSIKFWISSKTQ